MKAQLQIRKEANNQLFRLESLPFDQKTYYEQFHLSKLQFAKQQKLLNDRVFPVWLSYKKYIFYHNYPSKQFSLFFQQLYSVQKMSIDSKMSQSQQHDSFQNKSDNYTQDWVCIKCNNLNFSFRKKCNRCRIQLREQNFQIVYPDYYYYNQYYHYQPQALPKHSSIASHFDCQKENVVVRSTPQSIKEKQSQKIVQNEDELPSVSRLIIKYKDSKAKKIGQLIDCSNRSLSVWKIFGGQNSNTQSLMQVGMDGHCEQFSSTDDEEASQQFIKNVQEMIN